MLEIVQLPGERNGARVDDIGTVGLEVLTAGVDSSLNPQIDVSEARFVMC